MSQLNSCPKIVVLDRGNSTSCAINLHGATIVSWRVFSVEQLFVSSESRFDNLFPIKGGISVVYTHLGCDNIFMPNNGFARTSHWKVEEMPKTIRGGDIKAVFSFKSDSISKHNFWEYDFTLMLTVTLRERSLVLDLSVYNGDIEQNVETNFGILNYIKLISAEASEIYGLRGHEFINKVNGHVGVDTEEPLKINKWLDRIYLNVKALTVIKKLERTFSMKIFRHNLPDVALWNPWKDMVKCVNGLSKMEVHEMISIGNGFFMAPCHIYPLAWITVSQTLEAVFETDLNEHLAKAVPFGDIPHKISMISESLRKRQRSFF